MNTLAILNRWIDKHLANEDALSFIWCTLLVAVLLFALGGFLAPLLTALVLAFLLQGLVKVLERSGASHGLAVTFAFVVFCSTVPAILFIIVPLLWQQLQGLMSLLPTTLSVIEAGVQSLAAELPDFIEAQQINSLVDVVARELGNFSAGILTSAFFNAGSVVTVLIYVVIIPVTLLFLLKDRNELLSWARTVLPFHRPMLARVASEMNYLLGRYVRGKFIEILVVGSVSIIAFLILGLDYAVILGVLVGLSVLIPFVGAALVTLPVMAVGIIQFGWSWELSMLMLVYGVIQFLDGNVLVPVLFSEAVDLHPVTIIASVLAFGGLWGIWGVFFAIPLATFIKSVHQAWPSRQAEP